MKCNEGKETKARNEFIPGKNLRKRNSNFESSVKFLIEKAKIRQMKWPGSLLNLRGKFTHSDKLEGVIQGW